MKVLVLGSSGLLGSTLVPILKYGGHEVIEQSLSSSTQYNVDMSDSNKASTFLSKTDPEIIINLIGLTDVDRCEIDINSAYELNVKTVEHISSYIKDINPECRLIHISTDQVYDGDGLQTENYVTLKNYYAFSKYSGEIAARICSGTILRTNFFGKSLCSKRLSLTDWVSQSLSSGKKIYAFNDVFFNPLSMNTISNILLKIIDFKTSGTYNLGSRNPMSKADFIFKFAKHNSLNTENIENVSIDDVEFIKTYRPKNMQMDCSKIEKELSIELPDLQSELIKETKNYVKS